jgi:hypothetical protein
VLGVEFVASQRSASLCRANNSTVISAKISIAQFVLAMAFDLWR